MVYYIEKNKNGIITSYTDNQELARIFKYEETLDYEPISYKGYYYTNEEFEVIKNSDEYKAEHEVLDKEAFDMASKQFEIDAGYIQYKGKKISLQEILFKSLIYTSVTDAYVYLKTEDGGLLKVLRATFLLIVAKAKINLKSVEEALYNADNQFDPAKSLEENIAKIKGIFDAINKIFND